MRRHLAIPLVLLGAVAFYMAVGALALVVLAR